MSTPPEFKGWIGVDLDGTLAHYMHWISHLDIGLPIAPMVTRVKAWLAAGEDVRIFTARAGEQMSGAERAAVIMAIESWCWSHIGRVLPITATKDFQMRELWDARAVQVIPNTGIRVGVDVGRLQPLVGELADCLRGAETNGDLFALADICIKHREAILA